TSAGRARQIGDRHERSDTDRLNNQLSDSVTSCDAHRVAAVSVDQTNLDLTAIAGVNSSWRVHDADAMSGGQPRAGVHEGCVAHRQGDCDAGPHQPAFSWLKFESLGAS